MLLRHTLQSVFSSDDPAMDPSGEIQLGSAFVHVFF
jgi:hypothetical protein